MRYCPANTAHSQDAEDFPSGVVPEAEVRAAPITLADGGEGDGDATEGAEEEEDGDVGGGFVDGDGGG